MSSSQGKQYYCSIKAEFGRVLDDGTHKPKNPIEGQWVDLEYGEAVSFQSLVLRPAVQEIVDDSLKMGIAKARADGTMDDQTAEMLLNVIDKQAAKLPGKR